MALDTKRASRGDVVAGVDVATPGGEGVEMEESRQQAVLEATGSRQMWEEETEWKTYDVWMYSIAGAVLVGLSGILPLLVMPIEAGPSLRHGAPAARLKLMLSFAVGSLLGDVFCHLLPEVWNYMDRDDHGAHMRVGLWVIGGLLFFLIVEKLFGDETEFEPLEDTRDEVDTADQEINNAKDSSKSSQLHHRDRNVQAPSQKSSRTLAPPGEKGDGQSQTKRERTVSSSSTASCSSSHIKVSGYLNLFANIVDNFTHGLAVAGSFLVSKRVGILTTAAILIHEIPHEVGDFAILLRSGFDRWKAAKAQVLTATSGVFGAISALTFDRAGERTAWILAFTSGGFLYIALVTVVPDLLQEKHGRESVKQICFLMLGIVCMIFVTCFSG